MVNQKLLTVKKLHMNVDEDGFIKAFDVTTGNVHYSNCFTQLLSSTETEVYSDSAYASEKTDQWLKEKNTTCKVLERAYCNKPLTKEQKANNKTSQAFGAPLNVISEF